LGYDAEKVDTLLNKQSGMLGLTGLSDMRDIGKALQEGNGDAELALEIYAYRIKKYIGSYAAVLNGLDAIVFTAGVGENDVNTRQRICNGMQFLVFMWMKKKTKCLQQQSEKLTGWIPRLRS
jgi:acetate kinase